MVQLPRRFNYIQRCQRLSTATTSSEKFNIVLATGAMTQIWALPTRYTLQHIIQRVRASEYDKNLIFTKFLTMKLFHLFALPNCSTMVKYYIIGPTFEVKIHTLPSLDLRNQIKTLL